MKLLFLGTGAGVPAKARNVSSIALMLQEERNAVWLFDCGEATQHQILHTNLKPRKVEKIFISHLHGDHIFGLPGFLSSRSFQAGHSKLEIYGPEGVREYIETSLKVSQTHLKYPLSIIEIREGILFEDEQFIVECLLLDHGISSYGFRVVEKDRPGTLDAKRLMENGIQPGPLYQRLKNGETVILEDGRTVNGKDYIGPKQKGRVITILGDTRPCLNGIKLALNADVLVHESTFSADSELMAHEYFHSTTTQAAAMAIEANVERLCLTHISSRYEKAQWKLLEKEAKSIFPHTIMVKDFTLIEIPSNKSE